MEPTQQLLDQLYQEETERARRMPPDQKLIAPARLFDLGCRVMADGIRGQHPEMTDDEVLSGVRERLRLARALEQSS